MIETNRLLIKPFTPLIKPQDCYWWFDKLVMGQTFGGVDSIDIAQKRINRYVDHQTTYGFSKWLICSKTNNRYISDAGLLYTSDCPQGFDIGFRTHLMFEVS